MAPLNIAILGSGIFAKTEHKPAVYANPSLTNLIAVWSRRKAGVSAFTDSSETPIDIYSEEGALDGTGKGLDELLARKDLDAVIIALPILLQPEIIKKCVLAGKHVLSEKPIAKDLESARGLLEWYEKLGEQVNGKTKAIWAVAENFRFQETWKVAREALKGMGKVLGFRVQMTTCVERGGKYFETEWRKVPDYQGGFLLDGGVHFVAALQLLLDNNNPTAPSTPENTITRLSAFSAQLQPHLPPIDTLSSTLQLASGATGQIHISFGTPSWKGYEFLVACEGGSVSVHGGGRVVIRDGSGEVVKDEKVVQVIGENEKVRKDDGNGVGAEVKAFAESVAAGKGEVDPRQRPVLAYNDLVLIETMIQSAEKNGQPLEVKYLA